MKTEKRLTMALSVLVALMMLAVPLASSSNLFVDGGQTNSNGDAPNLGASTGYTITFQLNADGKSLDQIENLNDIINHATTGLNATANFNNKVSWYLGENNTILAIVSNDPTVSKVYDATSAKDGNITIQQLIDALYSGSPKESIIGKNGYTLTAWKDEGGNSYNADTSATDPILKSMTFAAQWELKQGFVEVPVTVDFGGDVKEYVKAYQVDADGKITVQVADITTPTPSSGLLSLIETVGNLSTEGYVINAETPGMLPVYSEGVVTYGDNKALLDNDKIPSTSTLKVTYTFNDSKYAKLTVHSIAFKDGKDVVLYADKDAPYNYSQIFDALTTGVKAIDAAPVSNSVNYETKDGKYLLTGWDNGAANLESTYSTTAVEFTLDAKLNGYSVVFMVNGQYEVVFVNFGELTADKCTLGVSGLNHWAWISFNDLKNITGTNGSVITSSGAAVTDLFSVFDFNMSSNIKSIEDLAADASYTDPDVPVAAIIACFESTLNTAYSVFDADTGYFGDNENITKIVIPGKADTDGNDATSNAANIPLPASNPVYDENMVFTGYDGYTTGTDVSKYGAKDTTTYFKADVEKYKYTITFQDGDKVIGVLYMPEVTSNLSMTSLESAVAIQYDGKMYPKNDVLTYLDKILNSKKDGYIIKQWNDADGKKMISLETSPETTKDFTSLTSNLVLYADFNAKSYIIKYINAFGGVGQTQKAYVDQNVTLYGTGTFIQEGYELAGWSTVPGAGGDEYKLGGTFVLSGADYEKLVETSADGETTPTVTIELYSIWEFNSVTPGDNTEGGDNNTALYLIAGMLLVIAVLGIAALFLLRRKN